MRNEELYRHSKRTAIIAESFSRSCLNLSDEELRNLYISAFYHDIGKRFIPNEILYKKGKLTEEEFEVVKNHPKYSFEILSNYNYNNLFNKDVLRAVREHHERIDGKGYPFGLTGNEISYISKIISICDSYEAMTSDRCYQKKKSKEEAIIEIEKGLGAQFDEKIGLLFINYLKKNITPQINILRHHNLFPFLFLLFARPH